MSVSVWSSNKSILYFLPIFLTITIVASVSKNISFLKFQVNNNQISIRNLKTEDDGIIECVASNRAANTSVQAKITVHGS